MKAISCKCERKDCFGNYRGRCLILNGTFEYPCPFFKTLEEFNEGIRKYGGIMRGKGEKVELDN